MTAPMSDPLFRPLSFYDQARPAALPTVDGPAIALPPPGAWPDANGGAGGIGRSGEPLVDDRFAVAWQAPLNDATSPDVLLVGAGRIVANGIRQRGIWNDAGQFMGGLLRAPGASWLDVAGQRLLANEALGLGVYTLVGARESTVLLAAPGKATTRQILARPGALALVTVDEKPHGAPRAVVETVAVHNYLEHKEGVLYGLQPLAGIVREDEATAVAAAAAAGIVLATPAGVEWRDWALQPRTQAATAGNPLALSVDEHGRAHLLSDDGGWTHLQTFAADGAILFDLTLDPDTGEPSQAPLVAPSGQVYLVSPRAIVAVSPAGDVLWRHSPPVAGPEGPLAATLSSNGLLLLSSGATLEIVTPDGRAIPAWTAQAPLLTRPVLANQHIYVATRDTLFALRPGDPGSSTG